MIWEAGMIALTLPRNVCVAFRGVTFYLSLSTYKMRLSYTIVKVSFHNILLCNDSITLKMNAAGDKSPSTAELDTML